MVLITIAVVGLGFKLTATSFLPEEDQGIIFANIQLGDTAGINQTNRTLAEISEQALKMKGIKYFISVAGYSLLGGGGENVALGVVGLDDWAKRKSKSLSIEALTEQLSERLEKRPELKSIFCTAFDSRCRTKQRLVSGIAGYRRQHAAIGTFCKPGTVFDGVKPLS